MKLSLFIFALWGGSLLVPAQVQAQISGGAQNSTIAAEPSGYELLVQAGQKILPGPNGGASIAERLTPEENLQRERLAVARNTPALDLVRLALQKTIEMPEVKADTSSFQFNSRMRELTRQFSQESDVRFADGDYVGAMNSKLDAMELGVVMGHGVIFSLLIGSAMEAVGIKGADKVGAHLDVAQCRAAMARLKAIEERRATFVDILRGEQQYNLRQALANAVDIDRVAQMQPKEDGTPPTVQDIAQAKEMTSEKLTANIARLFDAAVEASKLPYPRAVIAPLPEDLDPMTKMSLGILQDKSLRFSYARAIAQSRLLSAALELRAQKLETGAYPETFVAPVDPFSPDGNSLIYQKTAQDYLLYSVGPDGKEENGAEIQRVETNNQTGFQMVTDKLKADSTGDIVQTPF